MNKLKYRSHSKELLDGTDIPFEDIKKNMQELNMINSYLGGHKITLKGVRELCALTEYNKIINICEVGCGGADNLESINRYSKKKGLEVCFTGIDINADCIDFARQQYPGLNADWHIADYANIDFPNGKPDIIFTSLFCHHFSDSELIHLLHWMKQNSTSGFFINDLHRHPIAYHAIRILTRLFSKSYLVKNDAPLSVARGFTKKEWNAIFSSAGIENYTISWQWAFRHLIVFKHEK